MNDELVLDYIRSLTNLYGAVPKEKVVQILNMQNDIKIDAEGIDEFLTNKILEDKTFEYFESYFVKKSIIYEETFYKLLKQQENKSYYIPDRDELLKYKDDSYFERNKEYEEVKTYIKNNLVSNENVAEGICDDIQFICQGEDFSADDIIVAFQRKNISFKSEKQLKKLTSLISELSNNTRLYVNKGHTPNEICCEIENKVYRKEKIGRNDPCPCGSGKKYKKCCGTNY